jgi:hypothetical protein
MAVDEVRVLDTAIDEDRVLGIVDVRSVEERIVEDTPEPEQVPKLGRQPFPQCPTQR